MNNFLTFRVEAVPDDVNIMYRSNDGMAERVEAVSYIDVVDHLDVGNYDDKPNEGMSTHLAIVDSDNQGYFDYTSQHSIIMWRWLIATVSMPKMKEENSTANIIDDIGNPSEVAAYSSSIVVMPLYPVVGRLTMADNIEGTMIERSDIEFGTERAITFYRIMTDVEQGTLIPFGHGTFAEPYDSFIVEPNEDGMPAEPVTY